jgi:CBS domain-containing protein
MLPFWEKGAEIMKARDVMVSPVITTRPSASVAEVAKMLLQRRISAVPVVDDQGRLVGIVSEGDLLHRAEAGTERRRSWWLRMVAGDETLAADYVKAHGRKVADVMTRNVITATPETPLHEIAALMEKRAIKRVPIVENDQLVGIVSRANLIQAVASTRKQLKVPLSDASIREKVMAALQAQPWFRSSLLNVIVSGGVVELWGMTQSEAERDAIRVAAESTPGVRAVNDNLIVQPTEAWG